MTVIVLENAPSALRGELNKWLLEVKPGTFVGQINALVREKLWEKVTENKDMQNALIVYSANTEQGFIMKMFGEPHRSIEEFDGIQLIKVLK